MKKIRNRWELLQKRIPFFLVTAAFVLLQCLDRAGMLYSSTKGQLIPICVYIVLAISLNLVVGVSGELSLGHAGFMGVGAFSGIVAAAFWQETVGNETVRLMLAMVTGGLMAGIAGFLIGIPVLRLRGDYLAIVTLAFGEILKNVTGNLYIGLDDRGLHMALSEESVHMGQEGRLILAGPLGATGITKIATFSAGFLLILFSLFVVLNLIHSREGRAIQAVRDNAIAAESVGIHAVAFKMKAFVVSAFLAGMAGALYGLNYSSVMASKFNFTTSINILIYVVLGGMGNILGSVLAAAVLYILPEAMRGLEDYRMLIYAVVLIVVMLCTWSPKVRDVLAVFRERGKKIFRRREAAYHE